MKIERISNEERQAIKDLGYTAQCCVVLQQRIPREMGDTAGVLPFMLCASSHWADNVSPAIDRHSPICGAVLVARTWLTSRADLSALEKELPRIMSGRYRRLRGEWWDAGPSSDLDVLMIEIEDCAKDLGLQTLDDAQLLALIRTQSAQTKGAH